jgi:hypothetical protein
MDGNYSRTLTIRMKDADTIFFFNFFKKRSRDKILKELEEVKEQKKETNQCQQKKFNYWKNLTIGF